MDRHSAGRPEEVWAYLVVSDPGQSHTLPDQEAWARSYAAANAWRLTKFFKGVESGKSGTRGLCDRMVDEIEALPLEKRPSRILMIRLDRMGRGTGLAPFIAFARVCSLGITIETRQDGAIRIEKTQDSLLPLMRFYVGGFENDVRRDKLRATYAKKRNQQLADRSFAVSTTAPYGLKIVEGKYVAKEPEASAVRDAFQMAREFGSHRIAKHLKKSAPPWTLKDGRQKPQSWGTDRVGKLLKNPSYRGTLIDEDTWLLAQVRKGEFKRPTLKYDYALGSALRCVCGAPLRGHPGPGANRPATYRYYQCPNYSAHGGKMKHHRTDLIDAQFLKLLQQLTADHDLLESFVANATTVDRKALMTRLSSLRRELSTFESRRRAIFEAYEMQTVDKIALAWRLDDLRKGEVEITEQAAEIEDQLAIEKARRIDIADAKKIVDQAAEIWLSAPNDEQRAIAKGISTALGALTIAENGHLFVAKNALAQTEERTSGLAEQPPVVSRDLSAHDRGMSLRDRGGTAN